MLLHVLLFDKSYNLTYWLNYSELKSFLRRRYQDTSRSAIDYRLHPSSSLLANRLATPSKGSLNLSGYVLQEHAPQLQTADAVLAADLPSISTLGDLSNLVLRASRGAWTLVADCSLGGSPLLDVYGAMCSLGGCAAQLTGNLGDARVQILSAVPSHGSRNQLACLALGVSFPARQLPYT
jgi:hypothetical protein